MVLNTIPGFFSISHKVKKAIKLINVVSFMLVGRITFPNNENFIVMYYVFNSLL